MALPINQIMAQLQGGNGTEEDMGGDDVEVNKANEVAAEELDDEGEGGEGVNGLVEDMELELIDGDREGVKWLVINQRCTFVTSERIEEQKKLMPGNALDGEGWAVSLR